MIPFLLLSIHAECCIIFRTSLTPKHISKGLEKTQYNTSQLIYNLKLNLEELGSYLKQVAAEGLSLSHNSEGQSYRIKE